MRQKFRQRFLPLSVIGSLMPAKDDQGQRLDHGLISQASGWGTWSPAWKTASHFFREWRPPRTED